MRWSGVDVGKEGGREVFRTCSSVVGSLCVCAATGSRAPDVHRRLRSHDSGDAADASHHGG